MSQSTLQTAAAAQFTQLVEFTWGESNVSRYCRWNTALTIDSLVYSPDPLLTFKTLKALDGGTSETDGELAMSSKKQPLANAVRPFRHAKITVRVYEYAPLEGLASKRLIYVGKVGKVRAKRRASGTLIKATIKGIKTELNVRRVGLQCTSTCQNIFGDSDCGFDLAANTIAGTVSALNVDGINTRIAIDFADSPNLGNDRFARGVVRVDGLSLTIRQVFSEGTNPDPTAVIDLKDVPPPEWEGAACAFVPGCRLRLEDCREAFRDRESQFLALGYAMVPYNPNFYDAPGGDA
jgi:hypothetical protein